MPACIQGAKHLLDDEVQSVLYVSVCGNAVTVCSYTVTDMAIYN